MCCSPKCSPVTCSASPGSSSFPTSRHPNVLHWIDTLQIYWTERPIDDVVEKLITTMQASAPEVVTHAPKDFVNRIDYQPVALFHRLITGDHEAFTEALTEALAHHGTYWGDSTTPRVLLAGTVAGVGSPLCCRSSFFGAVRWRRNSRLRSCAARSRRFSSSRDPALGLLGLLLRGPFGGDERLCLLLTLGVDRLAAGWALLAADPDLALDLPAAHRANGRTAPLRRRRGLLRRLRRLEDHNSVASGHGHR
ncbi:Imm49 family immunity protein [Streptomyces sp. 8N114]|uniref:Imm49 family immunity protein n=1 Tax=Streptomyces sp. 8N114 TaxID=3457419 RepID=UPI003FCFBBF9